MDEHDNADFKIDRLSHRRHTREGGHPVSGIVAGKNWIPVLTGMAKDAPVGLFRDPSTSIQD